MSSWIIIIFKAERWSRDHIHWKKSTPRLIFGTNNDTVWFIYIMCGNFAQDTK